jgi:hypothetical protein
MLACARLALAILCVAIASGVALGARRDWTGSAACGACHPGELAAWQVTPHARTRERFDPGRPDRRPDRWPDRRPDRSRSAANQGSGSPDGEVPAWRAERLERRCLGCHTTGEAPAGPVIAVEVGCEACHGAGAAYAEADIMRDRPVAFAFGLADVATPVARAAVCAPCHRRATRGTPFDPMAPVHPKP